MIRHWLRAHRRTAGAARPPGGAIRRGLLAIGATLGVLLAGAFLLDRLFPPNLSRLATMGTEILDREGRAVAIFPAPGGTWRLRARPEDVAPLLIDTLIRTEDRHFWHHPGVNPIALARAAVQDLRAGRVVSGGSTLTMQAARLLEPRPRTMRSKLIEIARALQLEWHFSKREVLSIWMTLAPMGGNLEGVQVGARTWFGASARNLDAAQAALLVAIPRRPEAVRPDRHAQAARALRDRVLLADGGDVPLTRLPMPRRAVQAVSRLKGPETVATTLSLPLQIALERLATDQLRRQPERTSMAILVADARTRQIRAIVSGGEAPSAARAGALDLTMAVRSPGSALKPFIYAMAHEAGIAGPDTRVDDLPRHFGAYAPEDFDRGFAGRITAAEALRRSLNVPAVALLQRVGPAQFAARLKAAGVALHLPAHAEPSLPLALGGVGITVRDLAGLYAALATDGSAGTLSLVPGGPPNGILGGLFLAARSAAAIAEVLTQPFPDSGVKGVAWKTGTSWGGRDVWACGFDARHIACVWLGRPDGTPLPGATGRSLALPMLARVLEQLPAAPRPEPPRAHPPMVVEDAARANALRLLFPPPDAVVSGDGPVTLRAMGGQRPLTFLVNGVPLHTDPARREVSWRPDSPGFHRVTVVDQTGDAARVSVRVR